MPISAGNRLGPYEIVAPLGKGGMGQVFRAVPMATTAIAISGPMTRTGALVRVTANPANELTPHWSADGKQVIFGSDRAQGPMMQFFIKSADASGDERLL